MPAWSRSGTTTTTNRGPVGVNGRAAAGALTGRVTAAHSGAPLVGATVVADNGDLQLDTATDTNGVYRLDLLIGEWTVSATAPNYDRHGGGR